MDYWLVQEERRELVENQHSHTAPPEVDPELAQKFLPPDPATKVTLFLPFPLYARSEKRFIFLSLDFENAFFRNILIETET